MTTVVFLPGFNSDALVWRSVIAALPASFRSIALDIPAEPRLDRLIDRVAERIPEGSLIVGHSFGGIVAMGVAERHPDRVAGLVLVNTSSDADSADAAENRLARAVQARDGAFEEMAMENLGRVFHGAHADDPVIRAERLRSVRAYGAERYYAHSLAIVERADRTDFLRTLRIPVQVVAASDDLATPTEAQHAWASANGVTYAEIAGTGHMLPLEEPVLLAQTIADWWGALEGRDSALPDGPLPDYEVHGSGPVTLFVLHGAYGNRDYFEDAIRRWTEVGLRVVAWTCPGYGEDPVPEGFGVPLAAEYAARMVLREKSDVNVVLGHSMGGLIGPRLPGLVGDALDGLILSASSAGFVNRTDEDKEKYLAERVKPITDDGLSVAEYSVGLLRTMMAPGASGELVDKVVEVVTSMKTEAFLASMKAITEYNSVPSLEKLRLPTLLLAGEYDPACTPAGMRRMQQLIEGAQFHEIAGAGHYAFAEKPEEFHQMTTNFIASVRTR